MRSESLYEDKLIVKKAYDTIEQSQKYCSPCFYGFLNEHESQIIKDNIFSLENCMFFGGYEEATRVFFGANVSDKSLFPIEALKFSFKKEYDLSHRDFLGSFMALGIERSTIGDILVFDDYATVFVKSDLSEYIKNEVRKIGRVGVRVEYQDMSDIHYVNEYDELSLTVSSLRLDVIVSALTSFSREKSQTCIKSDLVRVNHKIENNVSKNLCVGDVITIRKFGKFVFTEERGLSKKGKLRISVNHFR